MTDCRELCAELADALDTWIMAHHYGGIPPQDGADAKLVLRARTALAQPELDGTAQHETTQQDDYDE
jgi:succinylarginine dihydrolase